MTAAMTLEPDHAATAQVPASTLPAPAAAPQRAVVFAYHTVGVRCLKVLLARGVDVALVVTHEDNPAETIWFESVAALCAEHGIATITPADPHVAELRERMVAARPEWIFSFYYRHMLPQDLLALAPRGAYNMHGSLLPRYRGRVPVNWAVLHGETETGATLHRMVAKADAGAIVAQTSIPILPDDTAFEVFGKLAVVAEKTLWDVLPAMLAGAVP
ncbi:MAG: formyltransferase, partial [Janthinobacterium lividum]